MRCERLPREQSLIPLDPVRIQRSKYVAELISLAYILAVSLKNQQGTMAAQRRPSCVNSTKHTSTAGHDPPPSQLLKIPVLDYLQDHLLGILLFPRIISLPGQTEDAVVTGGKVLPSEGVSR